MRRLFLVPIMAAFLALAPGCSPRRQAAPPPPAPPASVQPDTWLDPPTVALEPPFIAVTPEAPTPSPAPATDTERKASFWVALLHDDRIADVIGWIIGILATLATTVLGWLGLKNAKVKSCLAFVAAAVNETYHVYVRAAKAAHADGKLTVDEVAKARRMAMDHATEMAREKGIDLVRTLGAAILPGLIDVAVKEAKKKPVETA